MFCFYSVVITSLTSTSCLLLLPALKHTSPQDQSGSCRSLWVGNITLEVTEKDLWDLFKMYKHIVFMFTHY